jgi:hypothetical protein
LVGEGITCCCWLPLMRHIYLAGCNP